MKNKRNWKEVFSFKSAQCVLSYLGYKYHGANIDTGDSRCTLEQGTVSPRSSAHFIYVVAYNIELVTTSGTYSMISGNNRQYDKISGKFT